MDVLAFMSHLRGEPKKYVDGCKLDEPGRISLTQLCCDEKRTVSQKITKRLENQRILEENKECKEKQIGLLHFKQSKI